MKSDLSVEFEGIVYGSGTHGQHHGIASRGEDHDVVIIKIGDYALDESAADALHRNVLQHTLEALYPFTDIAFRATCQTS